MIEIGRFREGGKRSIIYVAREGNRQDNFPTLEKLRDYMKFAGQTTFGDLNQSDLYPPVEPLSIQEKMQLRKSLYDPSKPAG